jgi:integrase
MAAASDAVATIDTAARLLLTAEDVAALLGVKKSWVYAQARAKPLVSPHGLRHTAASVGLAHGVPLIAVSQQLGHARVDITAKVHAHLLDDS